MRIEQYFDRLRENIVSSSIVRAYSVSYDKRGTYEGFIRGEIYFVDGSILHFREFVDVEISVERLMYTYHYVDVSEMLIFRYDNTGHHKKLDLPTYPHHKAMLKNNLVKWLSFKGKLYNSIEAIHRDF